MKIAANKDPNRMNLIDKETVTKKGGEKVQTNILTNRQKIVNNHS